MGDYNDKISLYELAPRSDESIYCGIFDNGEFIGDIGAYKIRENTLQLYTSLDNQHQHLENSLRMLEKELLQNIDFEKVQLATSNTRYS